MAKGKRSKKHRKEAKKQALDSSSDSSGSSAAGLIVSEEEAGQAATPNSRSRVDSQYNPLPSFVVDQVIDHLIAWGGIAENETPSKLLKHLNEEEKALFKSEEYQRRIQNKFTYWRSEEGRDQYIKLVTQRSALASSSKKESLSSSAAVVVPDPDDEESKNRPPPRKLAEKEIYSIAMTSMQDQLRKLAGGESKVITVDTDKPEDNGGDVFVYKVEKFELPNGKVYSGHLMVAYDIDMRWLLFEKGSFGAWFVGGRDVVCKTPRVSYSFLHDVEHEKRGREKAPNEYLKHEKFTQPQDLAREAIFQDASRVYKHTLLRFPEQLETGVYSKEPSKGEIAPSAIPIALKHFQTSSTGKKVEVAVQRINIMWPIAVAMEAGSTSRSNDADELMDQVMGQLDGMDLQTF